MKVASCRIADIGFLASVLVVFSHVKWGLVPSCTELGCLARSVSQAAVAFFFVASGYFLSRRFDERGWWRRAVGKRIFSLGAPYFAWTVIYLVEMAAVDVALNLAAGRPATADLRGAWGSWRIFFGLDPRYFPALVPLWYVRNLFLLVLVSPAIKWLNSKFGGWMLVGTVVLHVVCIELFSSGVLTSKHGVGAVLSYCFTMRGMVFFTVGTQLGQLTDSPLRRWQVSRAWGLASLFAAVILAGILGWVPSAHSYFSYIENLYLSLLVFAAWNLVADAEWSKWLVASAFPMYLMHPVLFDVFYKVSENVDCNLVCTSGCWLVFAATVVLSVAITVGLRRFCPGAARILFGAR